MPDDVIPLLVTSVDDLDRGDWRSALASLMTCGDVGARPELVTLVHRLRCVARNQKLQSVHANPEAARGQLTRAVGEPGRSKAEPARNLEVAHLMWRVDRLVERDVADLEALRRIYVDIPRGRPELVYATLEFETMILFDPYTVRIHPLDRELCGLEEDAYQRLRTSNRLDLVTRATNLRHFAEVRSGSVSERTWNRAGGYASLREEALRVLAAEPRTRGRDDLPVRLGRLRAWQYARGWLRDTAA